MRINLVFHNITEADITQNRYELTRSSALKIIVKIQQITQKDPVISDALFYFDDGYNSFDKYIFPLITENEYSSYCLAIISDFVDTPGYLTSEKLRKYSSVGINIASHGASHAALVIWDESEKMIKTTLGGVYRNTPLGKNFALSENEIRYQMIESKKILEEKIGRSVTEFILPYGLYNDEVVKIAKEYYKTVSTCDKELDTGLFLRPRLLVESSHSIESLIKEIDALK